MKRLLKLIPILAIYSLVLLLIINSKQVASGVNAGIDTCITLVIPSLFIFMVVGNIIVNSKLFDIISLPFRPLSKLLRLDNTSTGILLLSLVGGYPIGAKLIAAKVHSGELSTQKAERLLSFCVNSGPAFLISGVGIAIFSSIQIGIMLYLSQVIACITIAFFVRTKKSSQTLPQCSPKVHSQSGSTLIVGAVSDAVRSMGVVCGLIVVFAAIVSLIGIVVPPEMLPYINGLLEVTTACKMVSVLENPVLWVGAFTAFCGVCVHMQISAMLYKTGVRMRMFILLRPIYTAVSCVALWVMIKLNPQPESCISVGDSIVRTDASSPIAIVFLLLLSIMLLFFSRKSDKI